MAWWARSALGEAPSWPRRAWRAAVGLAKVSAALHCTFSYVGFFSQVNGPSMFPTFGGRGWNVVVAEALPGIHERVHVGDVVICTRPVNAREAIIKRVTAVEGQAVLLYSKGSAVPTRLEVPSGHVWLQGDNLIMSRDSREYGPVPLALVRGRVLCQVLPSFKWVQSKAPGQA